MIKIALNNRGPKGKRREGGRNLRHGQHRRDFCSQIKSDGGHGWGGEEDEMKWPKELEDSEKCSTRGF